MKDPGPSSRTRRCGRGRTAAVFFGTNLSGPSKSEVPEQLVTAQAAQAAKAAAPASQSVAAASADAWALPRARMRRKV